MRFIDLFGGIGGFRLGIERATNKEWNCVWYCDVDKYAVQIYNERFGEDYEPADIRKIHERDIPGHDLICAGFPCQSFSTAGKRKGMEDTRGTLFFEICRIAKYHKPKMLLLENVRGLLSHDGGRTFGTILESLGELGYDVEWQVLNSKDYGVPQNRERVFIIGHPGNLSGRQVFPIGESNETPTEEVPSVYCLDANYSKGAGRGARTMILHNIHGGYGEDVRITEKYSPTIPSSHGGGYIPMVLRSEPKSCLRQSRGLEVKKDDLSHCPKGGGSGSSMVHVCETTPRIINNFPRSGNPNHGGTGLLEFDNHSFAIHSHPHYLLEPYIQNIPHGFNTGFKKEFPNLRASACEHNELLVNDSTIRRLTPVECERLQSFPDGWTEGISDTQRYKCLGNAVTVNVVDAIISGGLL